MAKPIFKVHYTYVTSITSTETDGVYTCSASDPEEARKMALGSIHPAPKQFWVRKIKRVRS